MRHNKDGSARALRVLKEVAEALNSAPTEGRAAAEALSRMADLLGVRTGWVWLRDPASDRFYSAAAQGLPPYLQEPVRMTGQSCWCLDLFQKGRLTARTSTCSAAAGCPRQSARVRAHSPAASAVTRACRCTRAIGRWV